MSSEVETSLEISGSKKIQSFLDSARNDKAEKTTRTTRTLFSDLTVHHDQSPHSAAMNMAVDESLLEITTVPTIRFYRWRFPALSFGYFGKFSEVAIYAAERDIVRRWTGGGVVFHGEDLTYSIVIPASDPVFSESSIAIYEKIHRALCRALAGHNQGAQLVTVATLIHRRTGDRRSLDNECFANPVRADVMIDDRKIAGAAQRRTRRGLLQQGSIQGITMNTDLAEKFAQALSTNCSEFEINEEVFRRARELAQQKYGTDSWLHKR
jgi:lipoyl(octanoyl) transferase